MRRSILMSRSAALVILAASALAFPWPSAAARPALTAKSLEGVWQVTKVVRTGADAGTDLHPQPSLQIFYRGYYSLVRDNSPGPRRASPEPRDAARLTDAEKIARYDEWAPYAASAGTYEIKGDKIITHNIVAKQVKGMTQTEEATIRFDGKSFVATAKSPPGAPAGERATTYTRIR